MNTAYQTLIVKFSEPIKVLDGIFDDAEAWGVDTLKRVHQANREQQVYRRRRPIQRDHHKRVQYGVPDGMVETKHTHCRDNQNVKQVGGVRTANLKPRKA